MFKTKLPKPNYNTQNTKPIPNYKTNIIKPTYQTIRNRLRVVWGSFWMYLGIVWGLFGVGTNDRTRERTCMFCLREVRRVALQGRGRIARNQLRVNCILLGGFWLQPQLRGCRESGGTPPLTFLWTSWIVHYTLWSFGGLSGDCSGIGPSPDSLRPPWLQGLQGV